MATKHGTTDGSTDGTTGNAGDRVPGAVREFGNLIDGKVLPAAGGRRIDSVEPSTGRVWARVPRSTGEDAEAAVAAARRAYPAWSALPPARRAMYLREVARVVAQNSAELAETEARDNGRIIRDVRGGDLPGVAYMWSAFAGECDAAVRGMSTQIGPTTVGLTRREPYGVVLGVIPWNAPLPTLTAKAGAALAAGNTAIVKPAEQASASSLRLAELIADVLPPGVLNIVSGLGEEVGDPLVRHAGVDRISLTGSTETGQAITRASADHLKPLALELGGKSPNIVFADADLDAAAVGVTTTAVYTGNAGQVCYAGTRILVQASILDEFLDRMRAAVADVVLGDALDPATTMGPIVSAEQYARVTGYLDLAVAEGAAPVFGGRHGAALFEDGSPYAEGYFVEPTLFRAADNNLRVCREEIFGPVAVVIPFEDEAEAVRIANDTTYGLAAGIWTQDLARAHRLTAALHAGFIWVNTYRRLGGGLPFAGMGDSGYGHDSVLENTREKSVMIELLG
ncbi:aldehyde dehydrogenase family protein [Yinghuangia sp. YIM S09857]|uniref:aldehyde dehydrogenase family protein n=1 Tax=Yinghuangia sp. YIM S09857 TaxID=3436929 RepID=UPI003F52D93C